MTNARIIIGLNFSKRKAHPLRSASQHQGTPKLNRFKSVIRWYLGGEGSTLACLFYDKRGNSSHGDWTIHLEGGLGHRRARRWASPKPVSAPRLGASAGFFLDATHDQATVERALAMDSQHLPATQFRSSCFDHPDKTMSNADVLSIKHDTRSPAKSAAQVSHAANTATAQTC